MTSLPFSYSSSIPTLAINVPGYGQLMGGRDASHEVVGLADLTVAHSSAETSVEDIEIRLLGLVSLLSAQAAQLTSTATIDGHCGCGLPGSGGSLGSLIASGGSTTETMFLDCFLDHPVIVPGSPAPNTELLNILGMHVVANEITIAGDGVTSRSIGVNALRIRFDHVLITGIGEVHGEIIIGHSYAAVTCDNTPQIATCGGDCDGDGIVSITELVKVLMVAGGEVGLDACPSADLNGDQSITIEEIRSIVGHAASGCPTP